TVRHGPAVTRLAARPLDPTATPAAPSGTREVGYHAIPARRSRPAGDLGPETGGAVASARRVRRRRHESPRNSRQRTVAALGPADHRAGGDRLAKPPNRNPRAAQPAGDAGPRPPARRGSPRRLSAHPQRLPRRRRCSGPPAAGVAPADLGAGRPADAPQQWH